MRLSVEAETEDIKAVLDTAGPEACLRGHSSGSPSGKVPSMIRDDTIIREINELWVPVYPFMVEHLIAVSGISGGRILDLGPFAGGLALGLLGVSEAFVATVIDESEAVLRWAREQAAESGHAPRLTTCQGPIDHIPAPDGAFDLVTVRGAFFFLMPGLLREIRRVLAPGGFGWVGGGYGPATPQAVIAPIAERSRALNEAVGKRRVTPEEAQAMVSQAGVEGVRVVTDGGLWLELRACV